MTLFQHFLIKLNHTYRVPFEVGLQIFHHLPFEEVASKKWNPNDEELRQVGLYNPPSQIKSPVKMLAGRDYTQEINSAMKTNSAPKYLWFLVEPRVFIYYFQYYKQVITSSLDCCIVYQDVKTPAVSFLPFFSRYDLLDILYKVEPIYFTKKSNLTEFAAMSGQNSFFQILQYPGLKVDEAAMDGACSSGHMDLILWINENMPELRPSFASIFRASANGHIQIVQWLVEQHSELLNFRAAYTLCLEAAIERGQSHVVRYLEGLNIL